MNHLADLPLIQALGWTLVHSLWQGAGVGLLAWAGLRLLRNRGPQARYLLACAGLAALPVLALGTLVLVWPAPSIPGDLAFPAAARTVGLRERLEPFLPYASAFWMTGVAFLGLRLLGGWYWLQRLRRKGSKPAPEAWAARLRALAGRMGLRGTVTLLESCVADAPMVIGWLRPVILVPAAALAGLSPAALEAVLAHELAHVLRHDYLVNLLQSVVEALFFHHPAVWWLSGQIRAEREHCCDDAAVRQCGDPILYARALADLEELRHPFEPQSGLAVASNGGHLMNRIRRLILPKLPPSPAGRAGLMALLAVTTMGAATGLGLREEPPAPQPPPREEPAPRIIKDTVRIDKKADFDAKAKAIQAKAEAFARRVAAAQLKGKAAEDLARLQKDMEKLAREMAEEAAQMAKVRVRIPRIEVDDRVIDLPDLEELKGLEGLKGLEAFKLPDGPAPGEGERHMIIRRRDRADASEVHALREELAELRARLDQLAPPAPPAPPAQPAPPALPALPAPPAH